MSDGPRPPWHGLPRRQGRPGEEHALEDKFDPGKPEQDYSGQQGQRDGSNLPGGQPDQDHDQD